MFKIFNYNLIMSYISLVGFEYPTSNLFLPELYNVKKLLDEKYYAENGFMHSMVRKMKDKFDKDWGDCNLLISCAVVLDPRNKMQLVDWCFLIFILKLIRLSMLLLFVRHCACFIEIMLKLIEQRVVKKKGQAEIKKESSNVGVTGKTRGRAEFYTYIKNVE